MKTSPKEEESDALVVTDVSYSFGEGESAKQVLYNNTLTLKRGEIVVLTGPSGSGKTTLLTLIGALRSLQHGSIQLYGKELSGLSANGQVEARRDIGFIFQAHNLFDALTARQNVKMALELHKMSSKVQYEKIDAILNDLGLEDRIHYRPAKLSGGQRQRVAIGRALVNKPKLVLADEPTAALDKDTGNHVLGLFRELSLNHRSTIIIVSHDARVIASADRIINMIDGHIASDVRVKETMYICQFLKDCPVFEKMSLSDLSDVAQKMDLEHFDPHEPIIVQGDVGDKFYLLKEGEATVSVKKEGKESIVATLQPGQFFGEVALLKEQMRNATITATKPVSVYSLSKENFLAAVQSHQSFEQQLCGVISSRC
ncbi:MAG: ATP-binding cassette domain-containing protein [Coraliomargaritaceae bacterium]